MKRKNKSGLTPEQYLGLELLTSHGMKYLPIPYSILLSGSPQAHRMARRGIKRNPRRLRGMGPGTALVGVLAGGIDVLEFDWNHPEAFTELVTDVLDAIHEPLAVIQNDEGLEFYFMKSIGLKGDWGPFRLLSKDCWVELPGSIRSGQTESHIFYEPQFPESEGDL